MGKSKPRVRVRNRTNPTAKPAKPPSDPELAAIREKRILPVVKDLQSAEPKTRSTAAKAITNIIEDEKCRKLLLREQIVKVLFEQTLTDSSLETRTAGWGILRNLALEEEADFSIHLFRQDILTAIEGVVRSIIETIESQEIPFSKLPQAQQDLVWSLSSSVINLLTTLAEAQDLILESITNLPSIIRFLFGLLSFEGSPAEAQTEILSCLIALTEDNEALAEQISDNKNWLSVLVQAKDSDGLKAVAACGVLHNLFSALQWFDHNTPEEGASDSMLIPTLVDSIENSSRMIVENNGTNGTNGTNGHFKSSTPDQVLQLALEITASIATTLQEALEHGSKHEKTFEGFDEEEKTDKNGDEMEDVDDEEGDEQDEDEAEVGEMTQDEIDADMDMVLGDEPEDDESPADEVTLDRLLRLAAPKVLSLAQSSLQTSPEAASIQNHALSALNNIAWTVSSIDFSTGHLQSLRKFWVSFSQKIWSEVISPVLSSDTADLELASSVTSLAWAVCRGAPGQVIIKADEQRKFMALYQASKGLPATQNGTKQSTDDDEGDAFQSLGVKSIGVLGRLALEPAALEVNREIGVFLLTILAALPETPAADAIEALNQIFDIYADKSYSFDEAVFWAGGFYKHLEEVQPKAKQMAKTIDKRKFGELRARADEAVLNLARFLKYKKNEKNGKSS